jgi:hypothetical protein
MGRWAGDEIGGSRGLDPSTTVIKSGIEASGADDGVVTFRRTMLDILQDAFEHTGDFSSTALEKFSGMSVTINRSAVGDAVSSGDLARAGPTDEVTFDGVAVGMGADDAAARVAGKIGRGGFSVKIERCSRGGKWFLLGWLQCLVGRWREFGGSSLCVIVS